MNCLHTVEKRNWLGNYPGGMLYFLGCHLIDLIYAIQGEPEEILPMSMPSGLDGVTADDFGMVVDEWLRQVGVIHTLMQNDEAIHVELLADECKIAAAV